MENRAINFEQKIEILNRLFFLWITHKELRLGQLINNCFINNIYETLYNIEDYKLIEKLEKFYKDTSKEKIIKDSDKVFTKDLFESIMVDAYAKCLGDCETCRNMYKEYITDDYNKYCIFCPDCKEKTMQVIKPGKVQCFKCGRRIK